MAESRDYMVELNNHLQSLPTKPRASWEIKGYGPVHATVYTAILSVGDEKAVAQGQGRSKSAAKAEAAKMYLAELQQSKEALSGANS